jgi:hypothetical protein
MNDLEKLMNETKKANQWNEESNLKKIANLEDLLQKERTHNAETHQA